MKKLMIAAAAAVVAAGAFADAQVYDYKLSLKTTTCAEGKVAKGSFYEVALGMEKGDEISYRKSASVTLNGVSWGCDCKDALAGAWAERELADGTIVYDGLTFWNKKSGAFLGGAHDATTITWDMMNRIGKKGSDVEMSFDIIDEANASFEFKCAGMGTIKDSINENAANCIDEASYIKSAKGNVAGFMAPDTGACYYCDEVVCDVYDFCECLGLMDGSRTVAYGTWTMKYNASASKKLRTTAKITSSYSAFPKAIKEALVAKGE